MIFQGGPDPLSPPLDQGMDYSSIKSSFIWVHFICLYAKMSPLILSIYMQQMTLADDIFRHIFFFLAGNTSQDLCTYGTSLYK